MWSWYTLCLFSLLTLLPHFWTTWTTITTSGNTCCSTKSCPTLWIFHIVWLLACPLKSQIEMLHMSNRTVLDALPPSIQVISHLKSWGSLRTHALDSLITRPSQLINRPKKLSLVSKTPISTTGSWQIVLFSMSSPLLNSWLNSWQITTHCKALMMTQGKGIFWEISINIQKRTSYFLVLPPILHPKNSSPVRSNHSQLSHKKMWHHETWSGYRFQKLGCVSFLTR